MTHYCVTSKTFGISPAIRRCKDFVLVLCCLILVGCKAELYSGLGEKEGNEMLAVLLDAGIDTEKVFNKKDREITLMVAASDVSQAVKLLGSYGYPKEKFSSVGDIFPKDGLISSPTEERARYTYSMSQELSATLSMIDGVIAARVHVVLPQEQDKLSDIIHPSSASVFIKYTPELELAGLIPKVKTLVSNSIEGLELDKITVSLFPASRISDINIIREATESVMSIQVSVNSAMRLRIVLFVFLILLLAAVGGMAVMAWLMQSKKRRKGGIPLMQTMQSGITTGINKVKEKTAKTKPEKTKPVKDRLPDLGDDHDDHA
ncbi:Yop proteins translocation lipoprotein J [invertebrate metagenome]|uniref:Yop proteins translocation lipoprotein J n=1 Tax=invertebrate metagenome TaxID=1711999 RepID=A0A2H9T9E5_9ZZZZ